MLIWGVLSFLDNCNSYSSTCNLWVSNVTFIDFRGGKGSFSSPLAQIFNKSDE